MMAELVDLGQVDAGDAGTDALGQWKVVSLGINRLRAQSYKRAGCRSGELFLTKKLSFRLFDLELVRRSFVASQSLNQSFRKVLQL